MNPKASVSPSSLLFLSFFLLLSSAAAAFNITQLLEKYPEFSNFNSYLTQTNLHSEINSRRTITVLAVENGALSSISGKSTDLIKKILSQHVILDYYDIQKLQKLSNGTALLTTLFQASGQAQKQQGFLNVTDMKNGEVVFGSAVQGADLNAKLVKSVTAQPYNISVVQISSPIVAPGIDAPVAPQSSPVSPSAAPQKAATPATATAPVPARAATPKSAKAPAPPNAPPPASPPPAEAPAVDATPPPKAEATPDTAAPAPSSGARLDFGYGFAIVMGLVSLLAL